MIFDVLFGEMFGIYSSHSLHPYIQRDSQYVIRIIIKQQPKKGLSFDIFLLVQFNITIIWRIKKGQFFVFGCYFYPLLTRDYFYIIRIKIYIHSLCPVCVCEQNRMKCLNFECCLFDNDDDDDDHHYYYPFFFSRFFQCFVVATNIQNSLNRYQL